MDLKTTPDNALPSPAWTFELLTGEDPECRLHGWVKQMQAGLYGEPTADQIWTQHREALLALAAQHNFRAYWDTRQRPDGPDFRAWRAAFLREHEY